MAAFGSNKRIVMSSIAQANSSNQGYNRILIEIIVNPAQATQTVIPIPQQQQILNARIFKIEVFTATDTPVSPSGNAVVTDAQLKTAYLNLYMNDMSPVQRGQGLYVQNQPMVTMHTLNNQTAPFEFVPFDLCGQVITWDNQSFIRLSSALGNTSANVSFLLAVSYLFTQVS